MTIDHPNFYLQLKLNVYERDIQCSTNTIMAVTVKSDDFSAKADMDIDIKEFINFASQLSLLYSKLKGTAIIQEPYGNQQFIRFAADKTGHIIISGKLISCGQSGHQQELSFENCVEQTFLSSLMDWLSVIYSKYR